MTRTRIVLPFFYYRIPVDPLVGTGERMTGGGGASPYDLPERVALDARASLARRLGASAVLV
ncbi:MAG: hypothetical protein ACXWOL_17700, partial [Ktedonobacteraceae bacterium]